MIGEQGLSACEGAPARILVFGGTSEGRRIVEWLSARGDCAVVASSLTEYGGSLVEGLPNVTSLTGALKRERMGEVMRDGGFACVVDATHPYAARISTSIREVAEDCGLKRYRVLREGEPEGPWTGVESPEQAAALAAQCTGNVLLTTGSKDLPLYVAAIADFRDRLYARILPTAASIAAADELEIPTSHVIAMQGPFSQPLNEALIREFDIRMLITKASGTAGGFWEKANAASSCGVELVVIHRPSEEEGMSLQELEEELEKVLSA